MGKKGLLILFTGGGKGKTSAAYGTALRAVGRGLRVAVVQFIKGPWTSGEWESLKQLKPKVEFFSFGEGFTWDTKSLQKDRKIALRGWAACRRLLEAKAHDVYIFDEILYALKYKFLSLADILKDIQTRSPASHLIITGRGAPKKLIAMADLVTEMKEIKHPYKLGILAQKGIDF